MALKARCEYSLLFISEQLASFALPRVAGINQLKLFFCPTLCYCFRVYLNYTLQCRQSAVDNYLASRLGKISTTSHLHFSGELLINSWIWPSLKAELQLVYFLVLHFIRISYWLLKSLFKEVQGPFINYVEGGCGVNDFLKSLGRSGGYFPFFI